MSYYLKSTIALLCCAASAPAMAQAVRATADVSVSGGYSNNPYLLADADGTATASISFDPTVYLETETGVTMFRGSVGYTEYLNGYDAAESAGLAVVGNYALDERTRLSTSATVDTSKTPYRDSLTNSFGDLLDPGGLSDYEIGIIDPTVIGSQTRVTRLGADLGIQYSLNEVSSLGASANASMTEYAGVGSDMRRFGGNLSYSRSLSPRTEISVNAGASFVNYVDVTRDDSTIYSPSVSLTHRLDDKLTVSLSGGIDVVDTKGAANETRVVPSGRAQLCRRGDSSGLCAEISQSAQPTALGTVNQFRSIGLNYDIRPSVNDAVSASLRWSSVDHDSVSQANANVLEARDTYTVQGRYTRRFGDRLSAFVTPFISKTTGDFSERDANYGASVGITLRIGNR